MTKQRKKTDGVAILHDRYVKGDPERKASLEAERVNAEVADMIRDYRKRAGLSQSDLADLVGTTQSVISRLEDSDYEGHSLSMLHRVADALQEKITVQLVAKDPAIGEVREAFHLVIGMLRRSKGLTVDKLATKLGIDREEVVAMERNAGYRPAPLVIHRLAKFFKVPERRLLVLAGAVKDVPEDIRQQASRFAAQSESFSKLTKEEQKVLDDFMTFLRTET